jgi:hypothetical protein
VNDQETEKSALCSKSGASSPNGSKEEEKIVNYELEEIWKEEVELSYLHLSIFNYLLGRKAQNRSFMNRKLLSKQTLFFLYCFFLFLLPHSVLPIY